MTLGNMREQGVRHLIGFCHNDACPASGPLVCGLTRPPSGAALSDWKTEHFVIYLDVAPFQFSGELDPECRHVCQYVFDARISRSPCRFGAVQCAYPAIQRVGHSRNSPERFIGGLHISSGRTTC
jgi:hypothetical protein